ncbi:ATPase involved in DNA repair [alpha proteobacterium HIMB59]|nr:ATPase involved in DNA repair [alpha proteobacterium HIMB59]
MLVSLEIRNFLLIKKLSINLIKGFNTFTGETGAGKSIIIDALKLALGGKNNSNLNLKDNEITTIKAVFEINQKIKNNLDSLNIEIEDDYLIVERQIDTNQKSKILLNNQITSLTAVKKTLGNIIEFQENYEQQELYNNKYFLDFIDKTGSIDTSVLKEKFKILKNSKDEYINHSLNEKNIQEKIEILSSKIKKIKLLNPKKNEYQKLSDQRNLNKNSKKIADLTSELKNLINSFNNNGLLTDIEKNIIKLAEFDKSYEDLSSKFSSSALEITEFINDLDNTFEKFDFNEIDFNDVEDRIYQYQQLSKFFEVDPDKLSEKYEQVEEEINQLQNFDKEKNKKYKKYQNDLGFFIQEAEKISSLRRKHSINLSKKINLELPDMNIEQGELLFEFIKLNEDNFNIDGIDELEIKFRTNKKADFSSIKKVASGGELSRLLLIIKSLSADFDNDLILIFDEVDSGLSGKIASNVSEKIMKLSKNNQIIAITHSAQVASKADKHWKIFKEIKGENLESKLIELSDKDRILEIATLISGAKITDESKKVASNLLKGS